MLSVILPTYNESGTVCDVIDGLQNHLWGDYEIIIVDDESPDGTARVVRNEFQEQSVKVLVRHEKSGLGSAVVDGMDVADGSNYLVMDADGQHRPPDAPMLYKSVLDGADMAVGSRHLDNSHNEAAWGPLRYAISLGGLSVAWAALPIARELADPMSGFFAVDAEVIDPYLDDLQPDGYKVLLEIMARCPVTDVDECPITFDLRKNGDSNMDHWEILRYLRHMARTAYVARTTDTTRKDPVPEGAD